MLTFKRMPLTEIKRASLHLEELRGREVPAVLTWTGALSTDLKAAGNYDPAIAPNSTHEIKFAGTPERLPLLEELQSLAVTKITITNTFTGEVTIDGALTAYCAL
jgi:hypothetical protein